MTPRGIFSVAVPAALAAVSILSCIGDPDAPGFNAHRAQWDQNEPALYAYTVRHVCFCYGKGAPVHVVASRESVLTAKMEGYDSLGILAGAPSPQSYSIDSLFNEVDEKLRYRHDSRRVSFDSAYGFPASVYIDFEKQAADEEYGLEISDFRPVSLDPL